MFKLQSQVVTSFGTVLTDDNELDAEYVLEVDHSCTAGSSSSSGATWAASVSDKTFRLYNMLPSGLCAGGTVKNSTNIQVLKFSPVSPTTLYTAAVDGSIKLWDIRLPLSAPAVDIHVLSTEELLSLDISMNDSLLAAAAGNSLNFYDIRSGSNRSLGQYSDCHSDIITNVRFNKYRPSLVTTVGEDGLVCSYDTSTAANSEAVVSILNAECPIRNFFFFGDKSEGICCLSSVETLTCWHFPSAQRLCNYSDIRSVFEIDYLVDGWYNYSSDSLYVLGGKYDGTGRVMSVSPAAVTALCDLPSGHGAGIRCSKYQPPSSDRGGILITGAEDARLSVWNENVSGDVSSPTSLDSATSHRSALVAKSQSKARSADKNPY